MNYGRLHAGGLTLFLAAVTALIAAPGASAHAGEDLGEFATADVDGVFSESEYEGSCTDTIFQSSASQNYDFTICEVSDETNDYWAIRISDLTPEADDSALIWFDNEHDGVVQPGTDGDCPYGLPVEDYYGYLFGGFFDSWYCNMPPVTGAFGDTGSSDGAAARTHYPSPGAHWIYEFSHPLDSGDEDDYSVIEGSTLGWCFMYNNDSDATNSLIFGELQYPPGCFGDPGTNDAASGSTATYADVLKESEAHDLFEAIKSKLKRLVATCKFCPPDPRRKLKDKINEVVREFRADDEIGGFRALKAFVRTTKKLIRKDELPRRAKLFVKLAKGYMRELTGPEPPTGGFVPGPGATPGDTHPGDEFPVEPRGAP